MKIGILTLPQKTNYGGLLQAFALQKVLRDMGHDVITINRTRPTKKPSLYKRCGNYFKRLCLHYICRQNVSTAWNSSMSDEVYKYISRNTQKFIDQNTNLTRLIDSKELPLLDGEYQFDAYVVGSDQVWLEYYCPNSFLDFVKRPNVRKVIYAASAGRRSVFDFPQKIDECKPFAQKLDAVSVREDYLVEKCKQYFDVDANWVLDPTMLLSASDYLSVVEKDDDETPILFSYVLDKNENTDYITREIANELKLDVIQGNVETEYRKVKGIDLEKCTYPSVDSWINGINRAKFVITDSFHGTVFAILFNKQFITICNAGRGAERFVSLLSRFGLTDRLILLKSADYHHKVKKCLAEFIEYSPINNIIQIEKVKSVKFLNNALFEK